MNVINKSNNIYLCSSDPTPYTSNSSDDNDVTSVMSNKLPPSPTGNQLACPLPSQFKNALSIATTQAIADAGATSIFIMEGPPQY